MKSKTKEKGKITGLYIYIFNIWKEYKDPELEDSTHTSAFKCNSSTILYGNQLLSLTFNEYNTCT
jgi:hypothetical protein